MRGTHLRYYIEEALVVSYPHEGMLPQVKEWGYEATTVSIPRALGKSGCDIMI